MVHLSKKVTYNYGEINNGLNLGDEKPLNFQKISGLLGNFNRNTKCTSSSKLDFLLFVRCI